ncbi:aminotransferase class V-fold PLP-dependent enzyme [Reinekea blandensis]|uniref:Aminotransferase n=1 Tax=Reinekea blandensis MED297 TaxID=314283 RepID=A4BFJ3_9GAMM|nr:aminotransferase class V-fold PLP-dependent enzyme [Reinekea blandensis]EAR09088.1 aminotransferase [Reinekea sp. MED297] [Reinekea blandensis MED297]
MTYARQPITEPATEAFWADVRRQVVTSEDDRLYADWTASGRLYRPIEDRLMAMAGGMMANTHTEDSVTGAQMTQWLETARQRIKQHVNAQASDVLLTSGSGMTGALAKFLRILGLWVHERHREAVLHELNDRPLVYITHREHHSNQTMWLESLAEVRIIPALPGDDIDLAWLAEDLAREQHRSLKFASVTAASNVTGILTPVKAIARLLHDVGGYCFVDYAAAAPYVDIDMHASADDWLDAIYFSPHKFLGGPGSEGVLVFNAELYDNRVPEQPGGGTVVWTNPWGEHRYVADIEARESGGTPGILQTLKTAMALQLKEEMGVERIRQREAELNAHFFRRLSSMAGITVLSDQHRHRLSVFSLVVEGMDYRTVVQTLSRQYGIETRGGCACAGTYGHYLLGIDYCTSHRITDQLDDDHQDNKPGWVRISLHPSMTRRDIDRIADALEAIVEANSAGADVGLPQASREDDALFAPLLTT